ncbi:MAG: hypothetical protein U1F66_02675 [bacterium]
MRSSLPRAFQRAVLAALTLLPCTALYSQSLSSEQKIDVIFNYAEACRWLKPSDCANLDPNFNDLPSVGPYRNLCGESRPASCLQEGLGLIPVGNAAGPLPLETFRLLETFIAAAKTVCNLDGGVQGCVAEDPARPENRRLVRTLAAKDPEEWYVFWPWLLARYAAFCGLNLDPQACLESFAPRRPGAAGPQVDTVFNYAEACHWLKPSSCASRDPNFASLPAVAPYRQLCGESSPAQCLLNQNLLPAPPGNRQPLSIDLFRSLESIAYNAKSTCNLLGRSYAACRNEDQARPENRRLVRDLWALDDNHAFTFMPWMLGRYLGFCGQNWDIPTCLAYFAPTRPSRAAVPSAAQVDPNLLSEVVANARFRVNPPRAEGEASPGERREASPPGPVENPGVQLGEPPRREEASREGEGAPRPGREDGPREHAPERPFHPDIPNLNGDAPELSAVTAKPPEPALPAGPAAGGARQPAITGGGCSLQTQARIPMPLLALAPAAFLLGMGLRRGTALPQRYRKRTRGN